MAKVWGGFVQLTLPAECAHLDFVFLNATDTIFSFCFLVKQPRTCLSAPINCVLCTQQVSVSSANTRARTSYATGTQTHRSCHFRAPPKELFQCRMQVNEQNHVFLCSFFFHQFLSLLDNHKLRLVKQNEWHDSIFNPIINPFHELPNFNWDIEGLKLLLRAFSIYSFCTQCIPSCAFASVPWFNKIHDTIFTQQCVTGWNISHLALCHGCTSGSRLVYHTDCPTHPPSKHTTSTLDKSIHFLFHIFVFIFATKETCFQMEEQSGTRQSESGSSHWSGEASI